MYVSPMWTSLFCGMFTPAIRAIFFHGLYTTGNGEVDGSICCTFCTYPVSVVVGCDRGDGHRGGFINGDAAGGDTTVRIRNVVEVGACEQIADGGRGI